ncbi:MAG: four helix bundle protein, partial [Deltaproteobacteria bacterium]|nr:four helix bundle protein [Deltaproteobacteria bacterium]MBI4224137.1 four helix bundle protein [Deltaproteobacteria bacterium]
MMDYKKIEAWILASDLAVAVYSMTSDFPKEERFGLVSQIRRAAISALANIAEGASRQYQREYLQFLYLARGSLTEAKSLLEISLRLSFVRSTKFQNLHALHEKTSRCLYGLIRAVEKQVRSPQSVVRSPNNKEAAYV